MKASWAFNVAGGDGDGGLPVLLHLDVLGVGRPGTECGFPVGDRQVIGHVALRPVTHHLGDADAVRHSDLAQVLAPSDFLGQRVDPVETEISEHGFVVCLMVPPSADVRDPRNPLHGEGLHEGRHTEAPIEEWVFAAWTPDARLGVISGHRVVGRTAWYWAALAREGRPLLHITDFEVPVRSDPFIVKGEALWAEHHCDADMEQWSIGNETYASSIE